MADTILEEIAAKTRERVAAAKRRVPPAEMERRAPGAGRANRLPLRGGAAWRGYRLHLRGKKSLPL